MQGNAPAGEGGEGGALNPMPGPKYVTARRDENASGTGALLERQEKPAYLPGAVSELHATEMGAGGRGKSPLRRILNFGNLHGVVSLSV